MSNHAPVVDERQAEWGGKVWDHPEPPGPEHSDPTPPAPAGQNPGPAGGGPQPPDGGDGGDGGDPGDLGPGSAPSRTPFVVPGDAITRQLCAAAHLSAAFADRVHDELVEPGFQGVAPNWNIDTVTLARHAEQAGARRAGRDQKLLVELVVALAAIALTTEFVGLGWFPRPGVEAFVLIAVAVVAVVYAVAFVIVWQHYSAVRVSAVAVVGGPGAQAIEPPPLADDVEQDLDDDAEANVMLFKGQVPFVGSGALLDHWTMSVDLSTGPAGDDGERVEPARFDSLELHEALAAAMSDSISPKPVSGLRMYVVGGHAVAVGGLFRSGPVRDDETAAIRFRRPVCAVPEEAIKGFLRRPHASARPYTYFELTGWDGQVVVTLFVRLVVEYPMLFAEASICALRPPRAEYGDVGTIPLGPGAHRLPVLRSVLPVVFPLLFNSPARPINNLRFNRDQRITRKRTGQVLARRGDVNFAAGQSLREAVASGSNGNHFGFIDEEMYYRTFSRQVLNCLRDCLSSRNVDLGEFDKQQALIVEKTIANAQELYGRSSEE